MWRTFTSGSDLKLFADIGNSRIKWELRKQRECIRSGEITHRDEDWFRLLDREWQDLPQPQAVWIASVAKPTTVTQVSAWCQAHWHIQAHFVRPVASAAGVCNAYAVPEKLGVDRWLTLVAARHMYSKAVCIADCGTAVTLDAMNAQGQHLGGIIVPGIALMQSTVCTNTDQVRDAGGSALNPFARSTEDGLAAGAYLAISSAIDRFTDRVRQLDPDATCLLTGGDAGAVAPFLQTSFQHVPNLVLAGLVELANCDA